MATTFEVFSLGTYAELDTVEGNRVTENADDFVGITFGGAGAPLSDTLVTMSQYGPAYSGYLIDNTQGNDQFQIDGNTPQTFDSLVEYNATLTYDDGSTATITAVVFQSTDGQTYLAPEMFDNADQDALEAKPIQSLTIDSVRTAGDDLASDRVAGTYGGGPDGVVDGTDNPDSIGVGYTDADGDVVTEGADVIDAKGGHDTISSGGGDDTVNAGEGDDHLTAGLGDDTALMGGGQDTAYGGEGHDSLAGGEGDDRLFGEDGSDTLIGGGGQDYLTGGGEADYVTGGDGTDTLHGGDGADTLSGGSGHDAIYGGEGADSLMGGGDSDHLSGGGGNDTILGDGGSNPSGSGLIQSSWNAVFLGSAADIDTDEGDLHVDGAASLLGSYGSTLAPLAGQVVRVDINDVDGDGVVDRDNHMSAGEQSELQIDGVPQTVDGVAVYNATVMFEDGSTGSLTAVVYQTADGNVYLAPEMTNNADMQLLESGSIQSISLDSVSTDSTNLAAERWDPTYADAAAGGADTIYAEDGDDVVYGGGGDDFIDGGLGRDTLDGGDGHDKLTGGDNDDVFVVSGGNDTIADFNNGNSGALRDGDTTNNDFVDLSGHYDHMRELQADMADDGRLNQSNTHDTEGNQVDYSDNVSFDGGSLSFTGSVELTADNTGVVCFTQGTMIMTPDGERPIETLKPGDLVTTMDNGPQPIVWIGGTILGRQALLAQPKMMPIFIKAGALGNERALLVSPQHGVVLPGSDILVRAKHLSRFVKGTRVAMGKRGVTYYHMMFERHQIVFSNGCPSESLYPGPMAMQAMSAQARVEIDHLFPGVLGLGARQDVAGLYGDTARAFQAALTA